MNKVSLLKDYFCKRQDIAFAFLFGSQAKSIAGRISDWDIAVYFRPAKETLEWEEIEAQYPQENQVWNDLIDILETDEVDLVVLNRVPSNIAASAVNEGIPLLIRDRSLFLDFMLVVTHQALDYRDFVDNFYEISQRSHSLTPADRERLLRIINFLEKELELFAYFTTFTFNDYKEDIHKRHDIERWIENIVNPCIDIGQIILASQRKLIPQSYKDIFLDLSLLSGFKDTGIDKFTDWVKLRNILAHEYLDVRWKRIEDFIKSSKIVLDKLLTIVKKNMLIPEAGRPDA